MRDGQHRQVGIHRERRTSTGELGRFAQWCSSAFGENQHPGVLLQALVALLGHLLKGNLGGAAVDGDRLEERQCPAEERYTQQLALEYLAERLEVAGKEEGFPGALVVGKDYAGTLRDVLHAAHFVAYVHYHPSQPDGYAAPPFGNEAIAQPERQERRDEQADSAPEAGAERQQQVEECGSDGLHWRHEWGILSLVIGWRQQRDRRIPEYPRARAFPEFARPCRFLPARADNRRTGRRRGHPDCRRRTIHRRAVNRNAR
ncbi:hypothetical protein D3C81_1441320 [compost metagenome]